MKEQYDFFDVLLALVVLTIILVAAAWGHSVISAGLY